MPTTKPHRYCSKLYKFSPPLTFPFKMDFRKLKTSIVLNKLLVYLQID